MTKLATEPNIYHLSLCHAGEARPFILIFNRETAARAMSHPNGRIWFIDGTFNLVTNNMQVLVILTLDAEGRSFPLAYAIMTGRTAADYRQVLEVLRDAGGEPEVVMMDFERAEFLAVREVFPLVQVRGCRFHLLQAARRRWVESFKTGTAAEKMWRRVRAILIQMTDAISTQQLRVLVERMSNLLHGTYQMFADYFYRQWMPIAPMWSMMGNTTVMERRHRTNNIAERHNVDLKSEIPRPLTPVAAAQRLCQFMQEHQSRRATSAQDYARVQAVAPINRTAVHQILDTLDVDNIPDVPPAADAALPARLAPAEPPAGVHAQEGNNTINHQQELIRAIGVCGRRGLIIPPRDAEAQGADGDCMPAALGYLTGRTANEVRADVAAFAQQDQRFQQVVGPFLDHAMDGNNVNAWAANQARPGTWGDHTFLLAFATLTQTRVVVVDAAGELPDVVIEPLWPQLGVAGEGMVRLLHFRERHYEPLEAVEPPVTIQQQAPGASEPNHNAGTDQAVTGLAAKSQKVDKAINKAAKGLEREQKRREMQRAFEGSGPGSRRNVATQVMVALSNDTRALNSKKPTGKKRNRSEANHAGWETRRRRAQEQKEKEEQMIKAQQDMAAELAHKEKALAAVRRQVNELTLMGVSGNAASATVLDAAPPANTQDGRAGELATQHEADPKVAGPAEQAAKQLEAAAPAQAAATAAKSNQEDNSLQQSNGGDDEACVLCAVNGGPQHDSNGDANEQWTLCDGCQTWYHDECLAQINEFPSKLRPDTPYECPLCRQKR